MKLAKLSNMLLICVNKMVFFLIDFLPFIVYDIIAKYGTLFNRAKCIDCRKRLQETILLKEVM